MTDTDCGDITRALADLDKGDRTALDRVLPLIYAELRALAGNYFNRQLGHTARSACAPGMAPRNTIAQLFHNHWFQVDRWRLQ